MKAMTNYQLKVLATQVFEKAMSIKVTTTMINLLEANTDGSYVFFSIGNNSYSYQKLTNTLAVYPNLDGKDGMVINL